MVSATSSCVSKKVIVLDSWMIHIATPSWTLTFTVSVEIGLTAGVDVTISNNKVIRARRDKRDML